MDNYIMNTIVLKPSFWALALTGILSFIVFVLLIRSWSSVVRLGTSKMIVLISMIGMLVGIHGLLHLGMESVYNYNPIEMMIR